MSNGRFLSYYWDISTLLSETDDVRDFSSVYSPDHAEIAAIFDFRIFLKNGLHLIAKAELDSNADIREHSYYYGLLTSAGVRIVAYDDAKHHQELNNFPNHMHRGHERENEPDPAYPSDLDKVSFRTVFNHILNSFVR